MITVDITNTRREDCGPVLYKGRLLYSWVVVVQVWSELRPLVSPQPIPRVADERIWNNNGQETTELLSYIHKKYFDTDSNFTEGGQMEVSGRSDPKMYLNSS